MTTHIFGNVAVSSAFVPSLFGFHFVCLILFQSWERREERRDCQCAVLSMSHSLSKLREKRREEKRERDCQCAVLSMSHSLSKLREERGKKREIVSVLCYLCLILSFSHVLPFLIHLYSLLLCIAYLHWNRIESNRIESNRIEWGERLQQIYPHERDVDGQLPQQERLTHALLSHLLFVMGTLVLLYLLLLWTPQFQYIYSSCTAKIAREEKRSEVLCNFFEWMILNVWFGRETCKWRNEKSDRGQGQRERRGEGVASEQRACFSLFACLLTREHHTYTLSLTISLFYSWCPIKIPALKHHIPTLTM
jgi:hypothetical protein